MSNPELPKRYGVAKEQMVILSESKKELLQALDQSSKSSLVMHGELIAMQREMLAFAAQLQALTEKLRNANAAHKVLLSVLEEKVDALEKTLHKTVGQKTFAVLKSFVLTLIIPVIVSFLAGLAGGLAVYFLHLLH